MSSVLLQGEPGSGKSLMACLTAINKPVHVIDIDRKIDTAGWARASLASGALTFWELNEPLDTENLASRVRQLASKDAQKASRAPQGWLRFAEYIHKLPDDEVAKRAGTWFIDSATFLGEHFKSHLMYLVGRSKYTWDQWNAYKIGWMDTMSIIRDLAKENKKDLIVSVHERVSEAPGDRTTGVRYETMTSGGEVTRQRTLTGTMDLKIAASIDGAFGLIMGAAFDEYYWLHVVVDDKGKPTWKCRVHPDGRRALRTSFILPNDEYEPDFRKIWRTT